MPTQTEQNTNQSVVSFGNGRYSPLMQKAFERLQLHFGLDERKAQHIANGIGSEIGAHMRNCAVTVKLGKISEDGKLTISEAAKLKGVTLTNNILALKAVDWIGEAGMNGVSYRDTKWTPAKTLQDYFDSI